MILGILDEIAGTASKKEKLILAESVRGTGCESLFKKVVHYAYTPYYVYNVLKFERKNDHTGKMKLDDVFDVLDALSARKVTGSAAVTLVENTYRDLSECDAEVFSRILQHDLRCGATASTFNKVWPGLVYEHPYQRCMSFTPKNLAKIKKPCLSEVKMDGMYIDIVVRDDGVKYMTRSGQIMDALNSPERDKLLMDCVGNFKEFVIQGEAVVIDPSTGNFMPRKEGNGYLNSDAIDVNRVVFVAWDFVPLDDFLEGRSELKRENRLHLLERLCGDDGGIYFIDVVEYRLCRTDEEVIEHFKEVAARGEEGTVVKNLDGKWRDGDSPDQVKIKIAAEGELLVTGVVEGEGRLVGMCGALVCQSSCGEVVVNVAGLSDKLRKMFFDHPETIVGKIITARYNEVIYSDTKKRWSLFLPRFVEVRTDKTEADDIHRLREQAKAAVDAIKLS